MCNPKDHNLWRSRALLTCEEMRRAEALSCARGTHDFWDLMQKAGRAVAGAAMEEVPSGSVLVLCGTGNNGGDGYVAAEALRQAGRSVRLARLGAPSTPEAQKAAAIWQGETVVYDTTLLADAAGVVDALFGTGLTRPLEGLAAQMVADVTSRQLPVVAADIPSGIHGDTGQVIGCSFEAAVTVTFFKKKRGHVLLPGLKRCGRVVVADTGMHDDVLDQIDIPTYENESGIWHSAQPNTEVDFHKYDRGHALIFGGAELTGASRLAARAAQRMGAGLVTLGVPPQVWEIYAKSLESVMVKSCETPSISLELMNNPKVTALLLGPGLGRGKTERDLVLQALATRKPCVLDADALTLFEGESQVLTDSLHGKCVLTPHEGEFERVFGPLADKSADKLSKTSLLAQKIGCVVLHKGADTVISNKRGQSVVNSSAPPWLATAGSGDVLAGMIAGRMAAGMDPWAAAGYACALHGLAAHQVGEGLIAEDLVEVIPLLLQKKTIAQGRS